ncbi:hypothetical protein [Paraburkholderia piptadeniae]|uniref:hypothetical protein n=1 Tax=Paraburkholderia piptadeniae TaxID=1701573 RepID=UPI00158CD336|nr:MULTISPECIES: hypothetical protein [Paraburkholderia]
MREMVQAAVVAGLTFVLHQRIDVRCDLDLRAAVVTASMLGNDIGAIEDAYLMLVRTNRERASHMRVRYRVA